RRMQFCVVVPSAAPAAGQPSATIVFSSTPATSRAAYSKFVAGWTVPVGRPAPDVVSTLRMNEAMLNVPGLVAAIASTPYEPIACREPTSVIAAPYTVAPVTSPGSTLSISALLTATVAPPAIEAGLEIPPATGGV